MTTIQQPTVLKLAEVIDAFDQIDESLPLEMLPRLSAELRRLHEVNVELLAAITKTVEANLHLADGDNCTLIDLVRVLEKNGVTV